MQKVVKCFFFCEIRTSTCPVIPCLPSMHKWRTLVARYARDNCVLTLMITWNYVCVAL